MENNIELVKHSPAGKDVTTSLLVAKVFGKNHDKVCRDIKALECSDKFRAANFGESSYRSAQNKELPMYEITKDGFSFLVMGYTGAKAAEFKETFIREFNKREAMLKDDEYILLRSQEILSNRIKMLEQKNEEKDQVLKLQEKTIQEQAPKVEYTDKVLKSESLIQITIIASELEMSAVKLNKMLVELGVIYRMGDTYLLHAKYRDKGYAKTKTFMYHDTLGNEQTKINLYWTEKGRKFIHDLFKTSLSTHISKTK